MYKKLLLLFFILITAPSYMIGTDVKAKEEGKIDDIYNIPTLLKMATSDKNPKKTNIAVDDRISNLFSDFLATLVTDPSLGTVLDDGIDSLKKFSTFVGSLNNTLNGMDKLTTFKENKQWEVLLEEYIESVNNKTSEKIEAKISQEDLSDRTAKFIILCYLMNHCMGKFSQ